MKANTIEEDIFKMLEDDEDYEDMKEVEEEVSKRFQNPNSAKVTFIRVRWIPVSLCTALQARSVWRRRRRACVSV